MFVQGLGYWTLTFQVCGDNVKKVGEYTDYHELQRIETAKSLLLSTNDAIYMIAAKIGFKNPYHFSTRFRYHVRVSPRAFREQITDKK